MTGEQTFDVFVAVRCVRPVYQVKAATPEEAKQYILDNPEIVLQDLENDEFLEPPRWLVYDNIREHLIFATAPGPSDGVTECLECGRQEVEFVLCPDGAEICRACYNGGRH